MRFVMVNLLTRCYDDFCHQNMDTFYLPMVEPEQMNTILLFYIGQKMEIIEHNNLPAVEGLAVVELDSF